MERLKVDTFGGAFVASSVASGSNDTETWAVQQSDNSVWNWSGSTWQQVGGAFASKIVVFSAPIPPCGHHLPWAINPLYNVFQYSEGPGCSFPGVFSQPFASAYDITTDLVVGTDNIIHVWTQEGDAGAFTSLVAAPWSSGATQIGGWVSGIFAIDPAGAIAELVPGK